jgi:tetratricopeptide (TPR) repeat protein
MRRSLFPALLAAACLLPAVATAGEPLIDGLGGHRHPISTANSEAQRYFDQGLVLAYAFNHAAAERAFREAARLDPRCAMCFWGIALVQGPHINAAMDPAANPAAVEALERALRLAPRSSEREQGYIAALARRYAAEPPEDRAALDQAYADAMRALAARYPDDPDAATLAAEALMDLHPWQYWRTDGSPEPWTPEILETLESVMARFPEHPGANHLLIHAVEASRHPERGVAAADRLRDLVPAAGHLVHMPGHIYFRVGRYEDTIAANRQAIAADERASAACHGSSLYSLAYVPHNVHFLWAAQLLAGQEAEALQSARQLAAQVDAGAMRQPGLGTLQHYWSIPLYTLAFLGRAEETLAEPRPAADLAYPTGVWRYARGLALVASGRAAEAEAELAELRRIAAAPEIEGVTLWDINPARALLAIAADALAAEIAVARGDRAAAEPAFAAAQAGEDALRYDEPPPWMDPVRLRRARALLRLGDAAAAAAAFEEALGQHPGNRPALAGLAAARAARPGR